MARKPKITIFHCTLKLAQRLRIEERVLFIGGISQKGLARLYRDAAVYLFPSRKEDFGIVMIEATGTGVPVVAWNSGGPTDIVLDWKTGFLAKPFDLDGFAGKTVRILKDRKLRQKMGRESWERVNNLFSWDRHIDILEKEIKKATLEILWNSLTMNQRYGAERRLEARPFI